MTQPRPARDAKISHERFFKLRPYLGMHESTSVLPSLFWGEERLNLPRSLDCLERRTGFYFSSANESTRSPYGIISSRFAHAFRHAIRACHRTVDGHRPEPAQAVGTAARFVDAADRPLAGNDGVVRAVLVDPGTKIE